jgi:hypothetical protein
VTSRDDAEDDGAMTAIEQWLLAPAPAQRVAALRVLVGGYAFAVVLVQLPEYLDMTDHDARRFEPLGLVSLLGEPASRGTLQALLAATLVLGAAFVAGWRFRVTGPVFALAFLALTTYRSAWGQVFHTENLVALHVLVLGCTRSADVWSLDERAGRRRPPPETGYGWPVRLMGILLVATYVVAGVTKLRLGGWAWFDGDVLRAQVAYDNLRKIVVGDTSSPLAGPVLDHAALFAPMAWLTLAVELGAPVALLGGRRRDVWVGAAWLFHAGILLLMAIVFAYPLTGIAFACLYPVERPVERLAARRRARRPSHGLLLPEGS